MTTTSSTSYVMPRVSNISRVELGEGLVGVLTQFRRYRAGLPRRAVKISRRRHHRHTRIAIGNVDDTARGVELIVGDDFLDRIDRRPEEVRFARKDFRPVVERLGREDIAEVAGVFC